LEREITQVFSHVGPKFFLKIHESRKWTIWEEKRTGRRRKEG
jgi:hypothetical protein